MASNERKMFRCAIYTRKSSEHGLEQDFNSLDAQREAGEAYIKSQAHEGWRLVKTTYDDGGLSGGSLERPALQGLLADIAARKIDVVVVYKVDRLTRSLADFAKLVELFEAHGVSFVSVTQQFNVRRGKARSHSGRQTHPATFAPAGSNRSSRGGNETAEASGVKGHFGDSASRQAATCSER
jgi:site-specific DNA recombinase